MRATSLHQRGSIIIAIFAAISAVGVVGAATMNTMKGPVRSMHMVTQKTIAENNMIAAGKLALMAAINQDNGGDCDSDGTIEPLPFSTTGNGPFPSGGGYLPPMIAAAKQDPWGNEYGYCVWDHGTAIQSPACGSDRLRGAADENGIVLAVISSGPDRVFQTSCGDAPDYVIRTSRSDDIVLAYSYAEAATMSGGLWNLKAGVPGTAQINKDIEVHSSSGNMVFGVDSTTDTSRPAIKVDYINRLMNNAVEFLANIRLGTNRISGDGGNHGLSFTGARGNFSHGLDITGNITLPGNTTITKDTTARQLLIYGGTSQATGAGIQLYGSASGNVGQAYVNFGGSENPTFTRFRYYNGTAWTNVMDIHSTGNVGIGSTSPQERLHIGGGNLRVDGRTIRLGAAQKLYGDNSSALYWDANNATVSQIILRNNAETDLGRLYTNASSLGLQEPGGTWSYRADPGASTMLYVGGSIRMRLYPTYIDMQANQLRNIGAPSADNHAATRKYVDDRVAAGTGFVEADPKIGTLTNNSWCHAAGGQVVCNRPVPVLTEADPKVGATNNGRWCRGSGSQIICDQAPPVASGSPTTQTFTANGAWAKPAGKYFVMIELWGGGQGGTGGVRNNNGEGGQGGAYVKYVGSLSLFPSSVSVIVGAGGAGGVGAAVGKPGGVSSFAYISAGGGGAGSASIGDIIWQGGYGGGGYKSAVAPTAGSNTVLSGAGGGGGCYSAACPMAGGVSTYGGNGGAGGGSGAGVAGQAPGGGGGGGGGTGSSNGGAGARGEVRITTW